MNLPSKIWFQIAFYHPQVWWSLTKCVRSFALLTLNDQIQKKAQKRFEKVLAKPKSTFLVDDWYDGTHFILCPQCDHWSCIGIGGEKIGCKCIYRICYDTYPQKADTKIHYCDKSTTFDAFQIGNWIKVPMSLRFFRQESYHSVGIVCERSDGTGFCSVCHLEFVMEKMRSKRKRNQSK